MRADRNAKLSGKSKGGRLVLFVNIRWCNTGHVTVKERFCCRDIKLLAVSLRHYYMPRALSHAIAVCVYVPPSEDPEIACDVIHATIARLQTQHPDAFILFLPWIPSSVKGLLNKKNRAFKDNQEELRSAQRELKVHLREAKESYRNKVEQKLRENNMREADSSDNTAPVPPFLHLVSSDLTSSTTEAHTSPLLHTFTADQTTEVLRHRAAPLQHIFNLSLRLSLDDPVSSTTFRTVALTSHVMKTLERLLSTPSQTPGSTRNGPPAVHLQGESESRGRHAEPSPSGPLSSGQGGQRCESHVL
ncbi:hypothetical protein NFI96_027611 [Prochilodus magdalenae]|nr:hypothetical protein NFI96_027611 [Prochilodus magdalenae]